MLTQPIKIGSFELKNRIIVPPVARQLANEDGSVTDKLIQDYKLHAMSGASMLIVEASYVQKNGQIVPRELSIEDDSKVEGLSKLASQLKNFGIPVIIQLVHAGRMGCNPNLAAPSAVPFENRSVPKALSIEEIETLVDDYSKAVKRAMKAGFDGVEIHNAHGYILSQFLSPLANKRNDDYGGTLENRSKLVKKIVTNSRSILGTNKILSVRLGACDCYAGGLKLSDSIEVSKVFETLGVDLINVSIGITPTVLGGSRTRKHLGFVPLAREIKKHVGIPVAVAGKITTKEDTQAIVSSNSADLVCVCRNLLADPRWPAKVLGMDNNPIITCKSCKACVHYQTGCPTTK